MPSIFSLSMLIIATALLLVTVLSANAGNNKEHNVKHFTGVRREDFIEAGRAKASAEHELVFAVNQLNLDKLEKEVINRATPGNKNYQKWLTFQQVGEMVTNKPAYEKVVAWLKTLPGLSVKKTSERLEYITVTAPISTWEAALKTEFLDWKDLSKKDKDGNPVVFARCKEYTIPTELIGSLDHVFYTVQVPPRLNKKRYSRPEEAKNAFREEACSPISGYSQATPSFLNNLYDITSNAGNTSLQQSVFETAEEYFSSTDLATFQKKYGLPSQAAEVPDGYATTTCIDVDCYEGNLDVQYMNAIAQNTPLIYYYVNYTQEDPFVIFATDLANLPNPPEVNSISWGEPETEIDSSTNTTFNAEAMKLGLIGVTITVSSGDNGAPDTNFLGTKCMCPSAKFPNGYSPSFPATSPWVTAVGATQGPTCGVRETVCMAPNGVITSGGGFSYLNNAPSWQTDNNAISDYFTHQSPVSGYNKNGRGYPDVAMLGVDFPVIVNGKVSILYGTSASSPLFAAMLTLVNTHRNVSGRQSVGFINPTLYKAGHIGGYFQDITSGDNKCCAQDIGCCTTGFNAATGWDPATGWGSMKLASMIAMFDNTTAPAYDDDFYNDDEPSSTTNIGLTAEAIAGVVIAAIIAVVIFGVVLVKCILLNHGKNNIQSAEAQLTNPMYANKGGSGRVDV